MNLKTLMTLACVCAATAGCSVAEVYDFNGKGPVPPLEVGAGAAAPGRTVIVETMSEEVYSEQPDEIVIDDSRPVDETSSEGEWRTYQAPIGPRGRVERADLTAPSRETAEPEAKDPPADLAARRNFKTYSSRPKKAELPQETKHSEESEPVRKSGSKVVSPWADKAVRSDNRASFDKMVIEAAARGKGTFEDEAGRVYVASSNRMEEGCYMVDITVRARGENSVARGSASVCDR